MGLVLAKSGLSAQQRVIAGIGYLDKTDPGWRARINRDTLNIRFDCTCAIAQVDETGSFNKSMKRRFGGDYQKAADLGFYAHSHLDDDRGKAEYAVLTKTWLEVLAREDSLRELARRHVPLAGQRAAAA